MAVRRRFATYNLVAPTREGWVFVALVAGVLFGAVNTGNNLVYLVLGVLLAMLVVANVLAEWNLRALVVERRLPGELFEGAACAGGYVLRNPRGRGAAWLVELVEQQGAQARAVVERCPASGSVFVAADFTFPRRGAAPLTAVRIESAFPFGLVRRWRDLSLPGEVLVYPRISSRHAPLAPHGEGDELADRGRPSDGGDFAGLRPWRQGDPLRRVHWPTSARVGAPMIVVRVAEGADEVVLRLDPTLQGEAREDGIRRLAGRVEAHLARGDRVGLEVDGVVLDARTGASWRRRLLTALALAEAR
ncbi:hypothetical protein LBMAG42_12740 [Deltaproteobacteria bacterium]|nr:hypothetical protein LBMAG42_12740 [Deltaproteobacteria bacterium]